MAIKKSLKISGIILTYNEEKHIKRSILSLKKITNEIIVIDSFSTDDTEKICKKINKVKFYKNKFINQSQQINWALKNINFSNKWIFRIDADEIITNELRSFMIKSFKKLSKKYQGFIFNRRVNFFGKKINFGSTSPHKTLRLWERKFGNIPIAHMDEQVYINGKVIYSNFDIIDHNLNSFKWWIDKHLDYAEREKKNYFSTIRKKNLLENYDQSKLNKKNKVYYYYKFPIFVRPFLLYFYCNIIKLGLFTGWQGFIFHLFQILFYRLYVDFLIFKDKLFFKNKKSA